MLKVSHEGRRPMRVEVQALVNESQAPAARRVAASGGVAGVVAAEINVANQGGAFTMVVGTNLIVYLYIEAEWITRLISGSEAIWMR